MTGVALKVADGNFHISGDISGPFRYFAFTP
jgi:hypothetical protein